MNFRELIRIILSNLSRMKFRVALTAAGVLIGTFAVILLVSVGSGLQAIVNSSFGSVGELTQVQVYNFSFDGAATDTEPITRKVLNEWRGLNGVTAVTPVVDIQAGSEFVLNRYVVSGRTLGLDRTQVEKLGYEMVEGSGKLNNGQILIGSSISSQVFDRRTFSRVPEEDQIDLYGKTLQLIVFKQNQDGEVSERRLRLRVAGVMEETGGEVDNQIIMSLEDVQGINEWVTGRKFNERRDGYNQVIVQVETAQQVSAVENFIVSSGYQAFSLQSILQQTQVIFTGLQIAFGCIGGIALIVAAIGIANTMVMAIYERTREIGLMKAVGATNRDVMLIFLGEAGFIGLIGGVAGLLLASGVGQIAGSIGRNYLISQGAPDNIPAPVSTPVWLMIFAIVFSMAIGIISGVYPAIRAVQLDPMMALKYE